MCVPWHSRVLVPAPPLILEAKSQAVRLSVGVAGDGDWGGLGCLRDGGALREGVLQVVLSGGGRFWRGALAAMSSHLTEEQIDHFREVRGCPPPDGCRFALRTRREHMPSPSVGL